MNVKPSSGDLPMDDQRQLTDLVSVGKATLGDFHMLGIRTVAQLKDQDPEQLYVRLCESTGEKHDICCLDVFQAAVAQAKNPKLPKHQCNWWYWSKKRKQAEAHE